MVVTSMDPGRHRHRWRDYRTAGGHRPVHDFLRSLSTVDRAIVVDAMAEVAEQGLRWSRHLRGDIWEVRASGENRIYRILFAPEGRFGEVLLSLEGFVKKTQKTPAASIELAEQRLRDWRARGIGFPGSRI